MKMRKTILSVLLAAVMVLGLASPAFAASPKITDVKRPIDYLASYDFSDTTFQDLVNGKTYVYPLTAGMFTWNDNVDRADTDPVTQAQFTDAGITLRVANMPSAIFEYIRLEYKAHAKTGNKKTMCVVVKFQDEYISTKSADFNVDIQLLKNRSRVADSLLELSGTIANKQKNVSSSASYVNIAKGEVLSPNNTIRNLEVDLGNGVLITATVYSNRLYYGTTSLKTVDADEVVINKFNDSLEDIVTLKTVGFSGLGGTPITLEGYSGYYIYNAQGVYLGTGKSALPYSNRYYCFSKKVDLTGVKLSDGTATGGSAGSSSSSSSTSSSSSSTSSAAPAATGKAYDSSSIAALASNAVTTAKNNRSGVATVKIQNAASITIGGLQAISRAAANAGLSSSFLGDTVAGGRVVGRMTITPKSAANLNSTAYIKLGVYVDSTSIKLTKDRFGNWFKNNMAFVSMDHKGNFGMTINIAAYVDLSKLNTSKLRFYCYNPTTNKYQEVTTTYRIDNNGYLYFSTPVGGDFIITDSALTKR